MQLNAPTGATKTCNFANNVYLGVVDAYRAAHASSKLDNCWISNYKGYTENMVSLFAKACPAHGIPSQ